VHPVGQAINELKTVAESTLTAIMGRMSAYTGQRVTWEGAELERGHLPGEPDLGHEPAGLGRFAHPGQTKLI